MLPRSMTLAVCLLVASLLGASSALAFTPPEGTDLSIRLPEAQSHYLHGAAAIAAEPAAADYTARLATELPGTWIVTSWNQYTQTPQAVEGSGLVLDASGFAAATAEGMEAIGRAFIAAHPALFGTDGSNLEVLKIAHGRERWGVIFQQVEQGVPVAYSSVLLAIHDNGRLFAYGVNLYGEIDVALRPTIEPQVARLLARAAVPFDGASELTPGADALELLPIHRGPGQVEFHLAHRTDVPTSEPFGLWRTHVDAHTGEIIHRSSEVHFFYEGSSRGDIEIQTYCDGDTPDTPNAKLYVAISGVGTTTTDSDGNFLIGGDSGSHTYTAQFDGPYFNVNCYGCTDALITGTIEPDTPEEIYWDAASFRADERDVFYFANLTKSYLLSIDPTWYLSKYTAYVNRAGTCNAYWTGNTINFYPAGGGCANTGTIGSVIAHEYGHGIQNSLIGGQGQQGLGEGNSDITGTFATDEAVMGRGFYNCSGGIRNCDNSMIYPDDLNGQIHHDGQIICAFNWHLRGMLEEKYGAAGGEDLTASLWHFARKDYGTAYMNQQQQVDYYRYADDDDGNLINGTPNWDQIYAAATLHGYSCPVNPNRAIIDHTPLADLANPAGPYPVEADVAMYIANVATTPDDVEIHYSLNGGAFVSSAMTHAGGGVWTGSIPTQNAGTAILYYLRVAHDSGAEFHHPAGAPVTYHMFGVGPYSVVTDNRMEADDGFTVGAPGDDATEGLWERGDPVGISMGLVFQPEYDHTPDPGTDCWVTGNSAAPAPFGPRLDGRTSLSTPVIDMLGANLVTGSLWAFTYFSVPDAQDALDVNLSTDGGTTWTTILHITTPTTPDWQEYTFRLSPMDHVFTSQMQFRFVAEDVGGDGIVEALVDDFLVHGLFGSGAAVGGESGSAPLRLALGHAAPNPFNPSTRIHYSLPERGDVRLTIYDVQGRLVRDLVRSVQSAGEYAVSWNGQDGRGQAAASGVYYYRLTVGDWSDRRTMVLLK